MNFENIWEKEQMSKLYHFRDMIAIEILAELTNYKLIGKMCNFDEYEVNLFLQHSCKSVMTTLKNVIWNNNNKNQKCVKINLGKNTQNPCNRNFKIVVKEIKGDLNKCGDIMCL